ncbi:GntR family transcriptional regulator [Ancylobacter sp. MQZ15Z-1]|uniref:GntR family transcriptional regulator n=1 Tax=Ancylobacter mangrovi TaxID=2972472 RepID=A0A9X2T2K8_9HYPH|nr:GntR family transcriptional regulator [Ancylobacter mangrovi]MCS0496280.1 GntR family transcriptional regulator [Ancylobacter mangrovi]
MNLVRNRVYEMVRRDILSCAIVPGSELREADLAERFGVSKSPVRDAMQKLEHEGLVEIEPRRGHRVRPVSVSDAADLLELRLILEAAGVRKAASVASDAELKDLDAFRNADTASIPLFTEYNRRFHCHLASLSRNKRLCEEIGRMMDLYERLCMLGLTVVRTHNQHVGPLHEHNDIIDALQARNGNAAARMLRRHIGQSQEQILRALESRPIVA